MFTKHVYLKHNDDGQLWVCWLGRLNVEQATFQCKTPLNSKRRILQQIKESAMLRAAFCTMMWPVIIALSVEAHCSITCVQWALGCSQTAENGRGLPYCYSSCTAHLLTQTYPTVSYLVATYVHVHSWRNMNHFAAVLWHSAASVRTRSQMRERVHWLELCKWIRAFRS